MRNPGPSKHNPSSSKPDPGTSAKQSPERGPRYGGHRYTSERITSPTDVVAVGEMYTSLYSKDIETGMKQLEERSKSVHHHEDKPHRCERCFFGTLRFIMNNGLVLMVNLSLALAVASTITLGTVRAHISPLEIRYLNLVGTMYLNALHCLLIPIIASSVIVSMARLDIRFLGSIGFTTFLYFMCTTVLAVMTGIVLVQTIKPGSSITYRKRIHRDKLTTDEYIDTILDMIRSLFPSSVVEAALYYPQSVGPQDVELEHDYMEKDTEPMEYGTCYQSSPTSLLCTGSNYPGTVVCYLIVGITLGTIGANNNFTLFFSCLNDALLRILYCLVWISPVGIYFLTLSKMVTIEESFELVIQVSKFCLTVMGGILIHTFITLPIVYIAVVRKFPFRIIWNLFDAIVAAFATSSSVATLPHTLYCMEKKNHIPAVVTRFVIPLGATVNVDGSALYEAVAPIFIAQLNELQLTITQVISISLTATLASLGTSGVPQAGLVNMMIALRSLRLPEEDVGLILAVDWILDRFRTAGNITGDSIGSAVVYHLCKEEIRREGLDVQEEEDDEILKLFRDPVHRN